MNRLFFGLVVTVMILSPGCTNFEQYTPEKNRSDRDERVEQLQDLLDTAVNKYRLPGIGAGYLRAGKDPVIAASGNSDLAHASEAISKTSSFRIGSTTKMFVAALLCRFVEQGKLDLADTLDKYLPDFPEAKTITIRSLLNHSSGIPETLFTDPWMMFTSLVNPAKQWQPAGVIARLADSSEIAEPKERKFLYSNTNYIILGFVAQIVGGAPLAILLEENFFKPLGMVSSGFLAGSPQSTVGLVPGYDMYIPLGPHLIDASQTSWDSLSFAAGAMYSSVNDLLLWLDALFKGRVVSAKSLALMQNWIDSTDNGRDEAIVGYGLGLALYDLGGTALIGHPGAGFGGECFAFFEPETATAYVVLYNLSRKDNPAGKEILSSMRSYSALARGTE